MNSHSLHKTKLAKQTLNGYLKVLFLLNPFISLAITWPLNSQETFATSFAFSLLVASLTATLCIWGAYLIEVLFQPFQKMDSKIRHFLLQMLILGPALYLSYWLGLQFFQAQDPSLNRIVISDVINQSFSFIALIIGASYLLDKIRELKNEKHEKELLLKKLEVENLNAKMNLLIQQLSPHFLFNSLNTLIGSIHSAPETAEDMALKLSDFYRLNLESIKKESHSLCDELHLVTTYLEIEKIRFQQRLQVEIHSEISQELNSYQVPVLILQPLVENAIKHGIQQRIEGGLVSIDIAPSSRSIDIKISNPLGRKKSEIGTKTGLNNVARRLEIFYSTPNVFKAETTESGLFIVTLNLPFNMVPANTKNVQDGLKEHRRGEVQ